MKFFLFATLLLACWSAFSQETPSPDRSLLLWKADAKLHRGDLSPLDEAFQRRDLRDLWYYFDMAAASQYGHGRTQDEGLELKLLFTQGEIEAMNAKIKAHAGSLLAQIPGHAVFLGEQIEAASDAPPDLYHKNEHARLHNMLSLSWLGSPEAVQQLGRFLEDERNPRGHISPGSDAGRTQPNWFNAAYALDKALGKKSPLEPIRPASGYLDRDLIKKLQEWWRSDASLPFRQPLPGVPHLPGPKAKEPSFMQMIRHAPWLLMVSMIGIILVIVLPIQRRRARNRKLAELPKSGS